MYIHTDLATTSRFERPFPFVEARDMGLLASGLRVPLTLSSPLNFFIPTPWHMIRLCPALGPRRRLTDGCLRVVTSRHGMPSLLRWASANLHMHAFSIVSHRGSVHFFRRSRADIFPFFYFILEKTIKIALKVLVPHPISPSKFPATNSIQNLQNSSWS